MPAHGYDGSISTVPAVCLWSSLMDTVAGALDMLGWDMDTKCRWDSLQQWIRHPDPDNFDAGGPC